MSCVWSPSPPSDTHTKRTKMICLIVMLRFPRLHWLVWGPARAIYGSRQGRGRSPWSYQIAIYYSILSSVAFIMFCDRRDNLLYWYFFLHTKSGDYVAEYDWQKLKRRREGVKEVWSKDGILCSFSLRLFVPGTSSSEKLDSLWCYS